MFVGLQHDWKATEMNKQKAFNRFQRKLDLHCAAIYFSGNKIG